MEPLHLVLLEAAMQQHDVCTLLTPSLPLLFTCPLPLPFQVLTSLLALALAGSPIQGYYCPIKVQGGTIAFVVGEHAPILPFRWGYA